MGDTMQGLVEEDLFKLMDDFSINDASCLIAGISPHKYYFEDQYGDLEKLITVILITYVKLLNLLKNLCVTLLKKES